MLINIISFITFQTFLSISEAPLWTSQVPLAVLTLSTCKLCTGKASWKHSWFCHRDEVGCVDIRRLCWSAGFFSKAEALIFSAIFLVTSCCCRHSGGESFQRNSSHCFSRSNISLFLAMFLRKGSTMQLKRYRTSGVVCKRVSLDIVSNQYF